MSSIGHDIYRYIANNFTSNGETFNKPITEELLMQLIGTFGIDILKEEGFIEPSDCPDSYIWCETRDRVDFELLRAFDYLCPICKQRTATELDGGWSPTKFNTYKFVYVCDNCGFLCKHEFKKDTDVADV